MSDALKRDPLVWISWLIGLVGLWLLAVGIQRSADNYSVTGSVDFRNRVVAARQAELGLNPYTFKWSPAFSDTLLDPSEERDAKYTRMTSPPTVLWIHSLFSDISWPMQKRANFCLNWISFLLIPLAIFYFLRTRTTEKTPLVGALIFATGIMAISGIWQFHVERGQQYSFLTLLLTLAVFTPAVFSRYFSAGAAAMRPTLGLSLFLCFREKRVIRAMLITGLVGVILILPALFKYPLTWWLDYLAASKDWYLHRQGMHERIPVIGNFSFPAAPEGDSTMYRALSFGAPGNIFHHYLMKMGLPLFPYSIGMACVFIGTAVSAWKLWTNRAEKIESYALRFFSAIYIVDLLLPSPRSAYNGILFFPVVLLSVYAFLRRDGKNRDLIAPGIVLIGATFALGAIKSPYSSPHMVETCFFIAAVGFLLKASSAFRDQDLQP